MKKLNVTITCMAVYNSQIEVPDSATLEEAIEIAKENGCSVKCTDNVVEGTKNANVIYTDIWVSMGEPDEIWESRIKLLKPYQVNSAVMKNASRDAIFLHCLPSFHNLDTTIGKEIHEKILRSMV